MKKLLIAMFVGLLAISVMATGVVFAQTAQPTPTVTPQTAQVTQIPGAPGRGGDRMGKHDDGPLRTYFEQALAKKLGLTDAQLQEKLTAGQHPEEIVAATGVATADIPAYMDEVRKTALANAVSAGVITQAQADDMAQRQPGGPKGNHADSPVHTYFEQALAKKLGLTDAQLQEKLTAGQHPEEIVAATGVATADIPAYMDEVRKTALANAVSAGVITQAQADEMAQHQPGGPKGNHADSPVHTYFEQALAKKLGLTDAQLQEKLTAGQRPEEIVAATGVATADIPALLLEVHKTALANAVTAGVITQAQADEMLQHIQDHPNGGGRHHDGQGPDNGQNVPNS